MSVIRDMVRGYFRRSIIEKYRIAAEKQGATIDEILNMVDRINKMKSIMILYYCNDIFIKD